MSDLDLNAIRKQLAADMRRSTPTKGAIQESALALLDRLAAVEAERDAAREQVRHMHDVLDRAEAERDAARGALARVRAARADHPKCDRHGEDDPVSCGWKQVVLDVDAALAQPEDGAQ